jgi:hypothetical protein
MSSLSDTTFGLLALPGVILSVLGNAYVEAINEMAARWP